MRRVLGGLYEPPPLPDDPPVRYVIDIGGGIGDFACWVYKQYAGQVFIDSYEPHPQAVELYRHNGPPGSAVHPMAVTSAGEGATLRVGADWNGSSLDPALGPRSGAGVAVSTIHPQHLHTADLLKIDAPGSEVDILTHYAHLPHVGVVMVRWYCEHERASVERLCAAAGLRLFKSIHEHVSRGLQIWIRSRAIQYAGKYTMPVSVAP